MTLEGPSVADLHRGTQARHFHVGPLLGALATGPHSSGGPASELRETDRPASGLIDTDGPASGLLQQWASL